MGRNKYLDKRAIEVIKNRIKDIGEISTEEVMDMVRPHFMFDLQAAREYAIRRQAHRIMASMRDEAGVRTCFAIPRDSSSVYVNIDVSNSLPDVAAVEVQLRHKIRGLAASYKKARKRHEQLEGQIVFRELISTIGG